MTVTSYKALRRPHAYPSRKDRVAKRSGLQPDVVCENRCLRDGLQPEEKSPICLCNKIFKGSGL